jgi:hypothetical protein
VRAVVAESARQTSIADLQPIPGRKVWGASEGDGFHLFFATSFCAASFPDFSAFFRVLFDNKPATALWFPPMC